MELGALLRFRMCSEIAEGLSIIHNLSNHWSSNSVVVHGDIKAENVLLTADFHCKIGDFGSAELCLSSEHSTNLTQTSSRVNEFTRCYAPPELLKNTKLIRTPSIDTYSYSMIIYLVLRRKYPFTNDMVDVYLSQVKNGKLPEPVFDEELQAVYDNDKAIMAREAADLLKTVAKKCQSVDPSRRPAMRNVADLLKRHLTGDHYIAVGLEETTALKNITIKQPRQENYFCQPIDCLEFKGKL